MPTVSERRKVINHPGLNVAINQKNYLTITAAEDLKMSFLFKHSPRFAVNVRMNISKKKSLYEMVFILTSTIHNAELLLVAFRNSMTFQ